MINTNLGSLAKHSTTKVKSTEIEIDKYISIDNILPNKQGIITAEKLPPKDCKLTKYNKDNILIGNIRPYLKKIYFAKESGGCSNDVLALLINNNFNAKYVYYALCRDDFFKHMMVGSGGSKMPRGDKNHILKFPIPDVKLEIQDKIEKFLSDIDNTIELNNKINRKLEDLAKLIYNHWFIQFDFPNKDGKPYKSSGGKMVYNNELRREIPYGWDAVEMSTLVCRNNNPYNFIENKCYDTIDASIMNTGTICINNKNTSDNFDTNLYKMEKFDILFCSIRPYLFKAGFSPFNGLVTGTTHSFKSINKDFYNFNLLTLTSKHMFKYAIVRSKGTKMPVIDYLDLLNYKTAFNKETAIYFNNVLKFKEVISQNIIQNHELSKLRDKFLPLLMNGQVKVK